MRDFGRQENIISLLFILALVLSSLKISTGLKCLLDIQLWDETDYLRSGVRYVFSSAAWGPFYTMFYYIQSLFENDMVELYYLNMSILSILVSISIFLFLRRLNVYLPIAVLASFLYLTTYGNFGFDTHVQNFAAFVIICTLIISTYVERVPSRRAVLAIGALIAGYVRAELFVLYIFFMAWLILDLWRTGILREIRPNRVALVILAILTFVWIPLKGLPLTSDRAILSFLAYHYERNRSSDSSFTEVEQSAFGGARNLTEAILANPKEFSRHMIANVEQLPQSLIAIIKPRWERFTWLGLLFFACLCLNLVAKLTRTDSGSGLSRFRYLLPVCVIFSIPPLLSAIVIYPHERYLMVVPLLFCLIVIAYAGTIPHRTGWKTALSASLILFLLAPASSNPGAWFSIWPSPCSNTPVLPNRAAIQFIRNLNLKDAVLFSTEGFMYDVYLPGCRLVEVPEMQGPDYYSSPLTQSTQVDFRRFIEAKGINVIVIGSIWHPRFDRNEPTFQDFMIHYQQYGFRRHLAPEASGRIVMVRS